MPFNSSSLISSGLELGLAWESVYSWSLEESVAVVPSEQMEGEFMPPISNSGYILLPNLTGAEELHMGKYCLIDH